MIQTLDQSDISPAEWSKTPVQIQVAISPLQIQVQIQVAISPLKTQVQILLGTKIDKVTNAPAINTMLCPFKVNSNTVELTIHTPC